MSYHKITQEEKFVNEVLLHHAKNNNIDSISDMFNQSEINQYIHMPILHEAANISLHNKKLQQYIIDFTSQHIKYLEVESIVNKDFTFFKQHFLAYADYHLSSPNIDQSYDFEPLFVRAYENDSNEIVKFLLSHPSIKNKPKIDANWGKALKTAYSRNNIELLAFLLYSPLLQFNAMNNSLDNFNLLKKEYKEPNEETIDFIHNYEMDMEYIKNLSKKIEANLDFLSNQEFKNYFENLLKKDLLNKYPVSQKKIISDLFFKAGFQNNMELVDYFLHSQTLPCHPNDSLVKDDYHNLFLHGCIQNQIELVQYLINNDNTPKNDRFGAIHRGIIVSCEYNAKEVFDLLYNANETNTYNLNNFASNACQYGHVDMARYILEYFSDKIDFYKLYPFESIVHNLFDYNPIIRMANTFFPDGEHISEEKMIEVIDFLFNTSDFNPKNHESLEIKNLQTILNIQVEEIKDEKMKFARTIPLNRENVLFKVFENALVLEYFDLADLLIKDYQITVDKTKLNPVFEQCLKNNKSDAIEYLIYQCDFRNNQQVEEIINSISKNDIEYDLGQQTKTLLDNIIVHDNISVKINKQTIVKTHTKKKI